MLSHFGVVDTLILDIDNSSSPPRCWMMVLGSRCFMTLLELPSDCMMMLYVHCHYEGCYTWPSCVGCVVGTYLMIGWVSISIVRCG
jgi:hypothetical protein